MYTKARLFSAFTESSDLWKCSRTKELEVCRAMGGCNFPEKGQKNVEQVPCSNGATVLWLTSHTSQK